MTASFTAPAPTIPVPEGAERFVWVAEVGRQAAEGLAHAHVRGIVHRDIKPANLMIDQQGNIWIADFGLARRLEEDVALTASGQVVGTPRYVSPEQAAASKRPVDHRTDIYSLGATLYELVTRRPAFDGPTPLDVLLSILERQPVPPRRLDPTVPHDLETIILKAMAKRPEDRYQTAQELGDDLRRFLQGEPVKGRRIGLFGLAARWVRRNPALASMTAFVLLSLTVGTVVSTLFAFHAESERLRAVESEDKAERRAEAEKEARRESNLNLYRARASLAATAWRDGEDVPARRLLKAMLPETGEDDHRGWEWRFLDRQLNGDNRIDLGVRHGPFQSAELSRDGFRLFLTRLEGKDRRVLEVCDAEDGRVIARRERSKSDRIAWRDDGKAAAWPDGDRVVVWQVDEDRLTTFESPGGKPDAVALAPAGDRLAVRAGKDRNLALIDLRTGKPEQTLEAPVGARPWLRFSPDGAWLTDNDFSVMSKFNHQESWTSLRVGEPVDLSKPMNVQFWDVRTNRRVLCVPGDNAIVGCGRAVVSGSKVIVGTQFRLLELPSGRERPLPKGVSGDAMHLSADGEWLALVGYQQSGIMLAALNGGQPTLRLRTVDAGSLAFTGRNRLRTLSGDKTLQDWDLGGRQWFTAPDLVGDHQNLVRLQEDQAATRNADGTRLAIASWRPWGTGGHRPTAPRGKVDVFDTDTRRVLFSTPVEWPYRGVGVSLDAAGKTLAWVGACDEMSPFPGMDIPPSLWVPGGGLPDLLRVVRDLEPYFDRRDLEVWDVTSGRRLLRQPLHGKEFHSWWTSALSPNGKYFVAGASTLAVWETASGKRLSFPGERERVYHVAFVPDGRLAVISGDGQRRWASLWDLEGPRRLWRVGAGPDIGWFEDHKVQGVLPGLLQLWIRKSRSNEDVLALVSDGYQRADLANGGAHVRCWSLRDGSCLIDDSFKLDGAINPELVLQGSLLVAGIGKRLVAWDVSTGKKTLDRDDFEWDAWTFAVSPDQRIALAYIRKGAVHLQLRDARGEQLGTLSLPSKGDQGGIGSWRGFPHMWFRGHRLQFLFRATADTWELHTLDGSPR